MKQFIVVLATIVLLLTLLYLNTSVLKDRETFVPCPDCVTGHFFQMLETKRYSIATRSLSDHLRKQMGEQELKQVDRWIREKTGEYQAYGGRSTYLPGSRAMSNVQLKSKSRELWPSVILIQEQGEWKIEQFLDPLPVR